MTSVRSLIESARRDLIDQGLRNPMINYKPRADCLDVVSEQSASVYKTFVHNKKMEFLPDEGLDQVNELYFSQTEMLPTRFNPKITALGYYVLSCYEIAEMKESDLIGPSSAERSGSRNTEKYLQTPYPSSDLSKRLLKAFYRASTFLEEQGVNALFLALGMLYWYESDSSNQEHRAPLVLIPATLTRASLTKFELAYTGDGVGGNLSLQSRLKNDFSIQIPLPEFDEGRDEREFEIDKYFTEIEEKIKDQARWRIERDEVALGFFAYSKYMMYMDLDPDKWADHSLENHAIISQLLGAGFSDTLSSRVEEFSRDELDDHLSVENNFHVVDADSSQAQAILAAQKGGNLIIQGPPGTGKSQTIANIIAEFIGNGKTVLFVSEKMAALEVVKRRLDAAGIGDLCLALHSYKTNKKAVLEELKRTLELGQVNADDIEMQLQELRTVRTQLNAYTDAVNAPIGSGEITPYQAFGRLLKIKETLSDIELPPSWQVDGAPQWTASEYKSKRETVQDLQLSFKAIGDPKKHPFWGSELKIITPVIKDEIIRTTKLAFKSLEQLIELSHALAKHFQIDAPKSLRGTLSLSRVVEAGIEYSDIRNQHRDQLIEQAWTQDLLKVRAEIKSNEKSLFRIFKPGYRRAISILKSLFIGDIPKGLEAQLAVIDDILRVQKLGEIISENSELGKHPFGELWSGHKSDEIIERKGLPASIITNIHSHADAETRKKSKDLAEHLTEYDEHLKAAFMAVQLKIADRFATGDGFQDQLITDQLSMLEQWFTQVDRIGDIVTFNQRCQAISEQKLESLLDIAIRWQFTAEHLTTFFEQAYLNRLIDLALTQRPELSHFSRDTHEQRLADFRELDRKIFENNRIQLLKKHDDKLDKADLSSGQANILRGEFNKSRRHKPIRKLISEAARAIQVIKPIFMMSPMSISNYLEPGTITFDLVVFDEASQIRPSEALGAIARGRQVIVVGDSKQLPPTSFFDSTGGDDELSETADMESILGLFSAKGVKEQMLRWHYRSQHESLIATSNCEFYENRLFIFPSPTQKKVGDLGLKFHHLPDTHYEGEGINRGEAKAIAKAIIEHAMNEPELSLGVVAFGHKQVEAIRDELEVLRRSHPETEPFFTSKHPNESFFVKNLENVQGDERDVIFISIGYGKKADGRLHLHFGPLNSAGGERRLNVLITRAKIRCEVFTNLRYHDIDLSRTQSVGIRALKHYLQYAETGNLETAEQTGRAADSPFEESVAQRLRQSGFRVEHQIGIAGFFIDLAIVDPEQPGRYMLGIECDGASYHRSASARERDRLRQMILEDRGWIIHRIWSTSWFSDLERELDKVVQAFENARQQAPKAKRVHSFAPTAIERSENSRSLEEPASRIRFTPYKRAILIQRWEGDIDDVSDQVLQQLIDNLVSDESPIHRDEVVRQVARSLGFPRTVDRIKERLNQSIDKLAFRGTIQKKGDFLLYPGAAIIPRNRRDLKEMCKIELIAPDEIREAVHQIVSPTLGIGQDELITKTANCFGFDRVASGTTKGIEQVIQSMLKEGHLKTENGYLVVTE